MTAMASRLSVGWLLAFLLAMALASFTLGWLMAAVLGVVLLIVAGILRQTRAMSRAARLTRAWSLLSAVLLVVLGWVLKGPLVANDSDNAYIWLWMMGAALLGVAVPFALAAVVPSAAARQRLAQVGIVLTWAVGAPGAVLLLLGAPLYLVTSARMPPGGMADGRVAPYHLIAALLLTGVVWLIGVYGPRQAARP